MENTNQQPNGKHTIKTMTAIIAALLLLVAVLALSSAYVSVNPKVITVTQQQFLTQTQSSYVTQTETQISTATVTTTSTYNSYGNNYGYPCYGQYCYGGYGQGQQITVYGYLTSYSNCINLEVSTGGGYIAYALYNLPSSYPTGYVTVQGYIGQNYMYGCSGTPLYVTNIY